MSKRLNAHVVVLACPACKQNHELSFSDISLEQKWTDWEQLDGPTCTRLLVFECDNSHTIVRCEV
jgi:uncharacterized protein YbaR (Trm112 family)